MVSNVWISEAFEADLHSILNYYCDELGMPTEARRFMEEVDRAKELIAEVSFVHSASNKAGLRERGCREHLVGGMSLSIGLRQRVRCSFCAFYISLSSRAAR